MTDVHMYMNIVSKKNGVYVQIQSIKDKSINFREHCTLQAHYFWFFKLCCFWILKPYSCTIILSKRQCSFWKQYSFKLRLRLCVRYFYYTINCPETCSRVHTFSIQCHNLLKQNCCWKSLWIKWWLIFYMCMRKKSG